MARVLVVEDDDVWQRKIADMLSGHTVVSANTIEEAYEALKGVSFDIILMDACVPGEKPNTMSLVTDIRGFGFTGPMVAISSIEVYRHKLVNAGCDHECAKWYLNTTLPDILAKFD
jgi:CheY-like chemotaxis protein